MAVQREKNYRVLNYGHSPVVVSTRYENFLIPGMEDGVPGSLPLKMDEIFVINSNSPVFKDGLLRFEEQDQEEIYASLRIDGWKEILTDEQIEEILLRPTAESLQNLIGTESGLFFERVFGVYIRLKNTGADVSMKVGEAVEARRRELLARKRKTGIRIAPIAESRKPEASEEVAELKRQLAEMRAWMAKQMEKDARNAPKAKKTSEGKE